MLELTPYGHVDPPYLHELRLLLDHALARSRVVVPGGLAVEELEERMRPRRLEDIAVLEKHLNGALEELSAQREEVEAFLQQNPGWVPEGEPKGGEAAG